MFDPIEIHGDERSDYHTRIYWDEEEQAIAVLFVHTASGVPDDVPNLFGAKEAEELGLALLAATDVVAHAEWIATAAAKAAAREKVRASVAAMVAAEEQRKAGLRAQAENAYGRE